MIDARLKYVIKHKKTNRRIITIKELIKILEYYTEILDVSTLREILDIGKNKAYELLETGAIKGFKIGKNWKISRDEVVRFIREGGQQLS